MTTKLQIRHYRGYNIHHVNHLDVVNTSIYKNGNLRSRYWSDNLEDAKTKAKMWIDMDSGNMTKKTYDKRIAKFLK